MINHRAVSQRFTTASLYSYEPSAEPFSYFPIPRIWWIVSPPSSVDVTARSAAVWYSLPRVYLRACSKSSLIALIVCDLPTPGRPCRGQRKGSVRPMTFSFFARQAAPRPKDQLPGARTRIALDSALVAESMHPLQLFSFHAKRTGQRR